MHMIWVVKLGGSLLRDDRLRDWLELLAEHGAGRVVIVPGGGPFADAARAMQTRWALDDVHAHNMAMLGMAQTAQVIQGLCPLVHMAANPAALRDILQRAGIALWLPLDLLRERADTLTSWDVTSDSLALWLGRELDATHVVLVKSCAIPGNTDLRTLAEMGIVDRRFPQWAQNFTGVVTLLACGRLEALRQALRSTAPPAKPRAAV
jgi:5-(aminomethyl)-3-furanmethanol phosphate kinase